jgi:hypothetical protein
VIGMDSNAPTGPSNQLQKKTDRNTIVGYNERRLPV